MDLLLVVCPRTNAVNDRAQHLTAQLCDFLVVLLLFGLQYSQLVLCGEELEFGFDRFQLFGGEALPASEQRPEPLLIGADRDHRLFESLASIGNGDAKWVTGSEGTGNRLSHHAAGGALRFEAKAGTAI